MRRTLTLSSRRAGAATGAWVERPWGCPPTVVGAAVKSVQLTGLYTSSSVIQLGGAMMGFQPVNGWTDVGGNPFTTYISIAPATYTATQLASSLNGVMTNVAPGGIIVSATTGQSSVAIAGYQPSSVTWSATVTGSTATLYVVDNTNNSHLVLSTLSYCALPNPLAPFIGFTPSSQPTNIGTGGATGASQAYPVTVGPATTYTTGVQAVGLVSYALPAGSLAADGQPLLCVVPLSTPATTVTWAAPEGCESWTSVPRTLGNGIDVGWIDVATGAPVYPSTAVVTLELSEPEKRRPW